MPGTFTPLTAVILIASGTALCASEVRVWGDATQVPAGVFAVPVGLNNAIAISASPNHVLALRDTGSVVAWGDNSKGQCDVPTAALSNVVAIDNEIWFSFALKSDGTLIGWGDNTWHVLDIPQDLPPVRSVHVQFGVVLAVLYDDTVRMWGTFSHPPPVGLKVQDAFPIVSDGGVSIKSDGSIFQWIKMTGLPFPDVPIGLSVVSLTNNRDSNITLSNDGTVTQWGLGTFNSSGRPIGLTGVIEATVGATHTIARKKDGTLVTWGIDANVPGIAPPSSWTNAVALSASNWYTMGIFTVGSSPTLISLRSEPIPYGTVEGTTIGDFSATDPDIGATFTFEFVGGIGANDNALFIISGTHLITASPIAENRKALSIRVLARDENGNSKSGIFPLTVTGNNNDERSRKCGLGGASIIIIGSMCLVWLRRKPWSMT